MKNSVKSIGELITMGELVPYCLGEFNKGELEAILALLYLAITDCNTNVDWWNLR